MHGDVPPIPLVLMGAIPAGPCWTWVMTLAAPPATAMTYVKPSRGEPPSVYGGGGSPSSSSLLHSGACLVSRGSAALVSATTRLAPPDGEAEDSSNVGGAEAQVAKAESAAAHSVARAE